MDTQKPRLYTEEELVAFGNYLLSEYRENLIKQFPDMLEERLRMTHHADIENFIYHYNKK